MSFHKSLTLTDIHRPYRFEYSDAAARTTATGFMSDDVGTVALQDDDQSLWLLSATTPTWTQISATGAGATPVWACSVSQDSGGQVFADGVGANITWDTAYQDSHAFAATPPTSDTLTVPTGGAGLYAFNVELDYTAGSLVSNVRLETGLPAGYAVFPALAMAVIAGEPHTITLCGLAPLSDGATFQVAAIPVGDAITATFAGVNLFRVGPLPT